MLQALVLGAVQGLTEFVPVSSSAHLVLVPHVLGWRIPSLAFDVAVHIGTALALVVYFRRELVGIVVGTARTIGRRGGGSDRRMARLAMLLAIGSVPAAVAGLVLERFFEGLFERPQIVAVELLATAGILFAAEAYHARRDPGEARDVSRIGLVDALVIGLLQAAAISPGVSRSGATISAGLFRGLTRDAAARFSFLLGLPAIIGAAILKLPDIPSGVDAGSVVAATAVSGVVGFLSIAFLLRYLRTRTMRPFAVYCVLFSAVSLGFLLR